MLHPIHLTVPSLCHLLNVPTHHCADVPLNWRWPASAKAIQLACCVSLCTLSGRAASILVVDQADALVIRYVVPMYEIIKQTFASEILTKYCRKTCAQYNFHCSENAQWMIGRNYV